MSLNENKELNCGCQNSCHKEECKGAIVETSTLTQSPNFPVPEIYDFKIPVVLSEFTVQIDVESKIKLAEPAIEIKRIKKNLYLTECRLVAGTCKVFFKGFVRKNIEYATKDSLGKNSICGDIKHTTVNVPFQCITPVTFTKNPKIESNPAPMISQYLEDQKCGCEEKCGCDMKETDMMTKEYFNEKVYCELVSAKIYEADIVEECEKIECHPVEHVFQKFTEKEVLLIKVKLLQNQQVKAYDLCHPHKRLADNTPCQSARPSVEIMPSEDRSIEPGNSGEAY